VKLYGLTGGIATGKSTVSRLLGEAGIPIIDADVLARQVVAPGTPTLQAVLARFPEARARDGTLDRAALGQRIFSDEKARAELNALVHPGVWEGLRREARALEAQGHRLAIYDAALLIETGSWKDMDGVIVVAAPAQVQVQRLQARNGLSEAQARARVASQLPLAEKLAFAQYVIDNGGALEQTRLQVEALARTLKAEAVAS
jgi:dephospho-CoA kinase